ncbi:hypothetical protein JOE48_005800 [Methylobacterium sp. PvR107]|nr:hypothetical protein [Methylobacterium sp. PvR107]
MIEELGVGLPDRRMRWARSGFARGQEVLTSSKVPRGGVAGMPCGAAQRV